MNPSDPTTIGDVSMSVEAAYENFVKAFDAFKETYAASRMVAVSKVLSSTGGDGDALDKLIAKLRDSATFISDMHPNLDGTGKWSNLRHAAADTIARLRERVAELAAENADNYNDYVEQVTKLAAELSSLKAAGTRADGIEAAAKVHEPSCSCPHPCDDYFIWPSPCHKKAAAVIRALSPAPDAKSVVEEKQELSPSNPLGDAIERGDHSTATPVSPPGGGT